MSRTLRRDIYGLSAPGFPIDDVLVPDPDPLAPVRYSCIFWLDHLFDSDTLQTIGQNLRTSALRDITVFLERAYLYWIEALSLLHALSDGVKTVTKLKSLTERLEDHTLVALFQDAHQLLLYNKRGIELAPLQTYAAALLFAPVGTRFRDVFRSEAPGWVTIKPPPTKDVDACLLTFEGHKDAINFLVFSHDSELLASASSDRTVRIWQVNTGDCLHILKGHTMCVYSTTFSDDSTLIASSSVDMTIRLWQVNTGDCLLIIYDHDIGSQSQLVFSHDSTMIADTRDDFTAIWDEGVTVVQSWDIDTANCMRERRMGGDYEPLSAAFSFDAAFLVTGSTFTYQIYSVDTGECLHKCKEYPLYDMEQNLLPYLQHHVHISRNMRLLATTSQDEIRIWEVDTGEYKKKLHCHRGLLSSVVLSHNSDLIGVSSTTRCEIHIWSTNDIQGIPVLESQGLAIRNVASSPDSSHLATVSDGGDIQLWSVNTGQCVFELEDYGESIGTIVFSPNSEFLISSFGNILVIWNVNTGQCEHIHEAEDPESCERKAFVVFSPDSSLLAWHAEVGFARILHFQTGSVRASYTLTDTVRVVTEQCVTFSDDSALLTRGGMNGKVQICRTDSGECVREYELENEDQGAHAVAFSSDSTFIAVGEGRGVLRIWKDNVMKEARGHGLSVTTLKFSHDSKFLASWSNDHTVRLWFANTGACLGLIEFSAWVSLSNFGPGDKITTNLGNLTVHFSNSLSAESQCLRRSGFTLSIDGCWIMWNNQNVLWLPPDIRSGTTTLVLGNTIAIGHYTGQMVFLYFSTKMGLSKPRKKRKRLSLHQRIRSR
ncbi:Vegetative incompatibility protein HET-E-1 [Cladobotryum mycophilum]|uniref:Vegetative incompatibility protein HET-E-1 n=1 Tax=Cladobotryum mycophilum TaxID=491253 RepID=A0ABR0S840_9HYPO